ncbi:MAG: hypothetical protein LAT83_23895 [Kiritimatiellae bacterium]|nr:hypothetical protein [Kiritimatiellia bacterium]
MFSIYNAGTRTVPLDAVWIEPLRLGETPFGVIFRNAEWLNRSNAVWVRQVLVEVPMPRETEKHFELPTLQHTPPTDTSDIWERWQGASERFQELVEMEHPHVEVLRSWIPILRQALDRGMVPSVFVSIGHFRKTQDLDAAAYVFGDIIQTWAFSRGSRPAQAKLQLEAHIKNPTIYAGRRVDSDVLSPMPLDAWQNFDYRYHVGRFRTLYFLGNISYERMLSGTTRQYLNLQFAPLNAYHHHDRNFHTLDFHKSLVEGLMFSQHAAIVRGGEPGGPFFPDGSDKGDHHWKLLKHVFRFGGPSHRKSHGNLLPANPNLDLGHAHWAVADNGKDSVHVIINNSTNRNGTDAVLEVPLPWSGPTRVLHHRVATTWSRSTASEIVSDNSLLEAEAFTRGEFDETKVSFRSWFKMGLKLEGMHLLELSPADAPPPQREIRAPDTVGYGALQETDRLFTVSRRPPPPWWAREIAISHHRANWHTFGRATLRVNVDATLGDSPDWEGLRGFHRAQERTFPGTSPLLDKSTRLSFPEDANETRPFVYAHFNPNLMRNADMIGLWVRAHRPPDFQPPPDWSRAVPVARFYMGKFPERQRIEIDYDTWYFISSPAEHWRGGHYRHRPRLVFQHDPETAQHPILEINAVGAYTLTTKGQEGDTPTLGFVQETESGELAILILGEPGSKGYWRQRLDRVVDPEKFHHVIDEALMVSGDSPDDPPPEEVRANLQIQEASRVLEIQIEAMPPSPSPQLMEEIRTRFPLISQRLRRGNLGAVLWVEQKEP